MPKLAFRSGSTSSGEASRACTHIGAGFLIPWCGSRLASPEVLIREHRGIGHDDDIHPDVCPLVASVTAVRQFLIGSIELLRVRSLYGLGEYRQRFFSDNKHFGNRIVSPL